MHVAQNTVVSFRFVMFDDQGNILQNTTETSPSHYLHGAGSIDSALQKKMEGSAAGDVAEFELNEQSGTYRFRIFIDHVRPANDMEISLGYPVVDDEICGASCVCYRMEK